MKAGILARADKPQAAALARDLAAALAAHGVEVVMEKRTAELAGGRAAGEQELSSACDLLIVLGGDGTILRALHRFRGAVPPVLGINVGSLGFLTGVSGEEWEQAGELRRVVRALLAYVNAKHPDKNPREWTCPHMARLDQLVPPEETPRCSA